ncbi:MAG: sigma-70 family RNA polymerase sigma factor [Verrucomicrobiota bacterium]
MHPNPHSLYSNLPPAMNAAQQTAAFASLEVARNALRSHLHESDEVAQAMITQATAAVAGENANTQKRYFEPNGPTAVKLQDYAKASFADRSKALHALLAKHAMYEECIVALKAAEKSANGAHPQGAAYFAKLRTLEKAYIEARNVIVARNLRLVASVASKHGGRSLENDDLIGFGVIGLQKAVEAYKPSTKNKFSTYAVPSIKGEIMRACENFAQEIRIPVHVWSKMREYDKIKEEMVFELGRTPTSVEMAQALDITAHEAEQLKRYHWDVVSIDAPVGEEEEGITLGETLPDHNADFFRNDYGDYADFVQPYLEQLDCLESNLLKQAIGYGFTRQMDFEEIVIKTGLTTEMVQNTLKSAIEKIAAQRRLELIAA